MVSEDDAVAAICWIPCLMVLVGLVDAAGCADSLSLVVSFSCFFEASM